MEVLIIRHYEPADLASCRLLWTQLTEWHREIYQSPGIGGDHPSLLFDEHLGQVGAEYIWVAEAEGEIVGMTGLIPGEDEAELEPTIVSPRFRGQGIGRRLAQTAIEAATENGIRHLKVQPVDRNSQAIRFYHQLGFNVIGHIELFQKLGGGNDESWIDGEQIGGKEFKV